MYIETNRTIMEIKRIIHTNYPSGNLPEMKRFFRICQEYPEEQSIQLFSGFLCEKSVLFKLTKKNWYGTFR